MATSAVSTNSLGSFLGGLFGFGSSSSTTYAPPGDPYPPFGGDTANFSNSQLAYEVVSAYQQYLGRQPSAFEIQTGIDTIQNIGYQNFVAELGGQLSPVSPVEPPMPYPQPYPGPYPPQPYPPQPYPTPYYPPQGYPQQPAPYYPPQGYPQQPAPYYPPQGYPQQPAPYYPPQGYTQPYSYGSSAAPSPPSYPQGPQQVQSVPGGSGSSTALPLGPLP